MLVRRANPPDAGLWGFPGGKIEFGETVKDAAMRELREETGYEGAVGDVSSVLVANRSLFKLRHAQIQPLLEKLRLATQAKG